MRRPFQLALLAVVGLMCVVVLMPARGPDEEPDRRVVEAGGVALKQGLRDSVGRQGDPILWGERLSVRTQCERERLGGAFRCRVVMDRYADRDRWCQTEYLMVPPDEIHRSGASPTCGSYSADGDPLPRPTDRAELLQR